MVSCSFGRIVSVVKLREFDNARNRSNVDHGRGPTIGMGGVEEGEKRHGAEKNRGCIHPE